MTQMRTWTLDTVRDRCDEVGECWIWKQSCKCGTTPQATINGKGGRTVKLFIFDELLAKSRPRKSVVRSSCGNSKCCSPAHLVWATHSSKVADSYKRGARGTKEQLSAKGRAAAIKNGFAKIDMQRATEIRLKGDDTSAKDLSAEYGITVAAIRKIWRGASWKPTGPMSIFNLGG